MRRENEFIKEYNEWMNDYREGGGFIYSAFVDRSHDEDSDPAHRYDKEGKDDPLVDDFNWNKQSE